VGQIPGGQHQIKHQVPSLGKDMKSNVQLLAINKKNENEFRPQFNWMQFFRKRRFTLRVISIKEKFKSDFYPDRNLRSE